MLQIVYNHILLTIHDQTLSLKLFSGLKKLPPPLKLETTSQIHNIWQLSLFHLIHYTSHMVFIKAQICEHN